jgi:hypothetical protein
VRSDPSPAPSSDGGDARSRETKHPRVIPIDATSDASLRRLFASEAELSGPLAKRSSADARELFRSEQEAHPPKAVLPPPPVVAGRFGWRNVSLALLAIVVLAQGGLMAYWMFTSGAAAVTPESGSVTVTSEPIGAPVTIDGSARGVTPLTVSLAAGSHSIAVGAGSQLRTQNLNVSRGGDAAMHVELAAAPAASASAGTGGLQIATEPSGARVWIDGEPRGVAPLTIPDLKVGDHVVTVRSGSGDAVNRTVTVQAASTASLIISMSSTAAYASGWLAITAGGVPLQIWEKGALVGTTATPRILLPAGAHELELVNTELDYRVARSVQIAAGQTAAVALKPPMGTISVNALPWAEVWIDGQRAGETPIGNVSIAIGNHEMLFRHPEFGEQRKTVAVGASKPVRVGVDMRKP